MENDILMPDYDKIKNDFRKFLREQAMILVKNSNYELDYDEVYQEVLEKMSYD